MFPSEGKYDGAVRASTATAFDARVSLSGRLCVVNVPAWTKGWHPGRVAAAAEVVARAPAVVATAVACRRRQGSVARVVD